jgi:hypothetical protein
MYARLRLAISKHTETAIVIAVALFLPTRETVTLSPTPASVAEAIHSPVKKNVSVNITALGV